MSMAAGEYVSVSSQSDTEKADLAREREELRENVEFEQEELAEIMRAMSLGSRKLRPPVPCRRHLHRPPLLP